MIIETPLYYKATDLQSERCQVDEVVTLGHWQFEYLKNCTLDDFDFIEKLRDKLPVTNDNTRHCVMLIVFLILFTLRSSCIVLIQHLLGMGSMLKVCIHYTVIL